MKEKISTTSAAQWGSCVHCESKRDHQMPGLPKLCADAKLHNLAQSA